MATRAWRHTAFMTVMALWYVGTPASAAAQDARVTLRVRNDAQVPGVLLADATARVEAIYAKAGIDATFVDAGADLIIVLLSRHTADNMRTSPDVLGFAPSALGRIAYVLQPRVDRLADGYRTSRAIVLGVAIAHEMGHLLMLDAHSTAGIMRPEWNQADFRQNGHDNLLFTLAQAAEMCARLTSRLATATPRPSSGRR
jgi:hypothetical protein